MADLTPEQEATRGRVEGVIAIAAPFLDVLLGFGERISRIAEPTDHEYYPIRPGTEPEQLPVGEPAGAAAEPGAAASAGERAGDAEGDGATAETVEASAEEIPLDEE